MAPSSFSPSVPVARLAATMSCPFPGGAQLLHYLALINHLGDKKDVKASFFRYQVLIPAMSPFYDGAC